MNQLDQIAIQMNTLYKEVSSRRWVQYTTGFDLGVIEAENRIKEFKKNKETFKIISDALSRYSCSDEKRKAQILYSSFKDYHLSDKVKNLKDQIDLQENKLVEVINKFRRKIGGKEISSVELGNILDQSSDRDLRRKAFESSLPLNQLLVDNGFVNLINLRKELSVAAGYDNFVDYALDYEELHSGIFKNWTAECSARINKYQTKSKKLAQTYLNLDNLRPWDQKYLKSQACSLENHEVDMTQFFKLLSKAFLKYGFDIEELNLTYDIFPRKNKSEWGYNFTIEMGKDSRVLANVSNKFSDFWVLMHETAHGVHYMGLNPEETIYNWGVSGIVSEGFANFMGNQCYSREFLSEVFQNSQLDQAMSEFQKLSSVVHFQNYRLVVDVLFDHQLYFSDLKSADDIQELRQKLGKQILGEEGYDVPWGRLIHHTSHPIYLHNYFIGDVMGENLRHEFAARNTGKEVDLLPNEFGQFWKSELLDPSGKQPFLDLYRNVFGKDISITEYVDGKCLQ